MLAKSCLKGPTTLSNIINITFNTLENVDDVLGIARGLAGDSNWEIKFVTKSVTSVSILANFTNLI